MTAKRELLRSRPLIEILILVFMTVSLLVGVGRLVVFVADVGLMTAGQTPVVERAGIASPDRRAARFRMWWGERSRPHLDGGDYLAVLDTHIDPRTPSNVIGTLIERERRSGTYIEALVIPENLETYGTDVEGGFLPRADGSAIESDRRTFYVSTIRQLTAVPIIERAYDPVLTENEIHIVSAEHDLNGGVRGVWMSAFRPRDGVWVLQIGPDEKTVYMLPRDASPAGDRL